MGSTYVHDALPTPTSIRLFHLAPGDAADPLRGEIAITNLESHPRYEAISYVWGSNDRKCTVLIDTKRGEKQLEITPNLEAALGRFRDPLSVRTLWIDSICIQQDNNQEKNQQVPLMGAVYRQASVVLIWLGEDPDVDNPSKIDSCMWKLHEAHDGLCALLEEDPGDLSPGLYQRLRAARDDPDELHQVLDIPLIESTEFQAFQELLRNPWFVRAWTWQESFVAKERLFHYGDQAWSRQPIVRAVIAIFALRQSTGLDRYAYENKFAMDMLGNESFWVHNKEYLEFRRILQSRRGSGCKYASDLIYSLLGAAKNSPKIHVDYGLPFEMVFTQCTWHLILQLEDLSILRDLERDRQPSNLPSWVPDWRIQTPQRQDVLSVSSSFRYRATGSSHPLVKLSSDSSTLIASGVLFDRVSHIEPSEAVDLEYRIAAVFSEYNDIEQIYAPTSESLRRALQRVWFLDVMDWTDEGEDCRWTADAHERYEAIWKNAEASEEAKLKYNKMLQALASKRFKRSAFVTAGRRIGIAAAKIQPGDVIALLLGGDVPFVLRPTDSPKHYTLAADCYLHGFMDGEGFVEARKAMDSRWKSEDHSWLEQLHESELPFTVQEFHIH